MMEDNAIRVHPKARRDVLGKSKKTSPEFEIFLDDEDFVQPARARDGQPKKQEKTGGMESQQYSKKNPHPKHIEDPKHYTYLGRPRCQHINRSGTQCHRTATVDAVYCSGHYPLKDVTCKGTGDFPRAKDLIVKYCREGYTVAAASARCDINPATVSLWKRKGKEALAAGKPDEYSQFLEDLEMARLYACSSIEKSLYTEAIRGNVSACIRYLECRMPDVWNAKRVVEMTASVQQDMNLNVPIDLSGESDNSLRSIIKNIANAVDISIGKQLDAADLSELNGK